MLLANSIFSPRSAPTDCWPRPLDPDPVPEYRAPPRPVPGVVPGPVFGQNLLRAAGITGCAMNTGSKITSISNPAPQTSPRS
jgi:hypothetical protein